MGVYKVWSPFAGLRFGPFGLCWAFLRLVSFCFGVLSVWLLFWWALWCSAVSVEGCAGSGFLGFFFVVCFLLWVFDLWRSWTRVLTAA